MDFSGAITRYPSELIVLLLAILVFLPLVALMYCLVMWVSAGYFTVQSLAKEVKGKHVLVTGASKGLGLEIAVELAKAGAHVTLVARGRKNGDGVSDLDIAVHRIKEISTHTQRILACPIDLTSSANVHKSLADVIEKYGKFDWLVCNAGAASPGFVVEQLPSIDNPKAEAEWMMESNVYSAVFVCRSVLSICSSNQIAKIAKGASGSSNETVLSKQRDCSIISGISALKKNQLPSRIILVGSVMSLLGFIGFSSYSASKYAIRGFADCIRSELKPLNVKVHLYMPGNMATPGFLNENSTKPKITAKIEGSSATATPNSAARFMLASVISNRYYISNDVVGELARISVTGGAPRPNLFAEVLCTPLLALVLTVWCYMTDYDIKQYYAKGI